MKSKKNALFFLINSVVIALLFFISSSEYNLHHFINALFYIAFFYLSLSIIMYITSKRFFDGVTFGFRRFLSRLPNNNDLLDEWKEKPLPSEKVEPSIVRAFFFQASLFSFLMLAMLLFYYM